MVHVGVVEQRRPGLMTERLATGRLATERLATGRLATGLVPGPVDFQVLLPDGYASGTEAYPLLLCLHGGLGGQDLMRQLCPLVQEMGTLAGMVIVAPRAGHSFYLDYRDGSQRWETFLVVELLPHIRSRYRICPDRSLVAGISMGGMGALRLGLKYPDVFGGIVAWEPSIEPALTWADVKLEDRFWRSDEMLQVRFGQPLDEAYWAVNNPAFLAATQAEAIRSSGIRIYLEAGSDDVYGLHRGAEFLHRTLYDHGIPHEYRTVLGADHIGPTIVPRLRDGLAFIARLLCPDPPDPKVRLLRDLIAVQKRRAGITS
jgi:S-formylglutathione hydrolase